MVYRLNVLQGQRVAHFHGDHFIQGPYVPAHPAPQAESAGAPPGVGLRPRDICLARPAPHGGEPGRK